MSYRHPAFPASSQVPCVCILNMWSFKTLYSTFFLLLYSWMCLLLQFVTPLSLLSWTLTSSGISLELFLWSIFISTIWLLNCFRIIIKVWVGNESALMNVLNYFWYTKCYTKHFISGIGNSNKSECRPGMGKLLWVWVNGYGWIGPNSF